MIKRSIVLAATMAATLATSLAAAAQECPDRSSYEPSREIIADMQRIVAPGGVQESYRTRIGGIEQWLNVRGQDRDNPMILFVHGGPAAPITPTTWQFQRPMEEYFTVVNWDQRGAGKTYNEATPPDSIGDTIHIQRYVDDAIEVAQYLRKRYHKDKLILVGHSWGTIVGMGAALKRPDLFYAYVGIGQVINTRDNERISYDFGVEQARAHNNEEAMRELASIAPYPGDTPITRDRIILARKWPQFYGGLTAFREDSNYYYRGPRLSPDYNDVDRCAINLGSVFSLGRLLPEFLEVDFKGVREFPIPVVMFMGRHDYTTPSQPTGAWLEKVKAPYKQGVWFERSAHMMPWEEPGKTLTSLLQYVRPLATGEAPPSR
ncbi:alpha/beta hydrolase [Lysobacter sp. S4-A87]|uniref:alpha/beta hydrolase n=1 Tax=Lysobacter sp. S4-A87 TaxID=2925843 RepID=UPI001F52EF25|nr:alpha/beta hydrolase [Lysobacter sp. S4-A87]UNK50866.1 alpha/beta hydrolase [Lysobacter sp. S4-A87]